MNVSNVPSSTIITATIDPSHEAILATLTQENKELREKIAVLVEQVEWFQKQLFGPKSEKRPANFPHQQLSLFTEEQLAAAKQLAPAPAPITVPEHSRKPRPGKKAFPDNVGASGLRFDSRVEIEEVVCPNPAIEGLGTDQYEIIGEEIADRLCQRASSYYVRRYKRAKVKLKGQDKITTAPAPPAVIPGSYADVSFLAGMIVDKILFHLPLYRIHQRLVNGGICVARGTLTNYVHAIGDLLQPVFQVLMESILRSELLSMDETPIKAGLDRKKRKMNQGYLWGLYGDQDEVAFEFFPSRKHVTVEKILGQSFSGVLLTDDYKAYSKYAAKYDTVTQALCWSHTRRYFIASEGAEPQKSAQAIRLFQELYSVERQIREKGLSGDEKLRYREQHSTRIVDEIFGWLKEQLAAMEALPTSPFTKACAYAIDNEKGLRQFLNNPATPLDTNHLERANKVVAMGKKNWLFCSTEIGAEYLGILYSLLYTARLQDIDPYMYLVDILPRVESCPTEDLYSLTPRGWKLTRANSLSPPVG